MNNRSTRWRTLSLRTITVLSFLICTVGAVFGQTATIGSGTNQTTSTGSDPINGYYESFHYQVVYTAAELTTAGMAGGSSITALGWSVSADYAGGDLNGYEIRMAHTAATNSASHDAATLSVVRNAAIYNPTVTAAGAFDMLTFDTPFVWNGSDNLLVDVCTAGPNAFTSPYGRVRTLAVSTTNGSRAVEADGGSLCSSATTAANTTKPQVQFSYTAPPACSVVTAGGTTTAVSSTVCPSSSFTLNVSGAASDFAGGITYQWYAATDSPTFTSFVSLGAGATGASLSTNITGATAFRRETICGASSQLSTPITISVSAALSIPTSNESFEGVALPGCWANSLISGTNNMRPDNANDGVPAARTGTYFLGKDYDTSDAIAISPQINMTTATAGGARVNLWIYRSTVNIASDRIRVHVNTSPNLTGASQILEIFPLISVAPTVGSAGWYNYTANIPSGFNASTAAYVIVQGTTTGGFSSYGIGVDDLIIENQPSCLEPTAGAASNITATSADFTWTPGAAETAWDIEWGADGFTLGTGTQVLGLTSAAASITTFASGTAYDVYYRADCGGAQSAWSGPISVTTPPGCGDVFRDPGGLGNYADNTNVTTTIYPSTPGDVVTATFTSFAVENSYDELYIYNGPSAASPLIGMYYTNPGVVSSSDISGALTFVFTADGSTNFSGWEANITCSPAPTCGNPSVSAVTPVYNGVSFTINASGIGTPAGYFYEIVGDGVTPTGVGTSSGSSVSATGLTALTAYDLYVQTDCGLDGLSSWVGPIDFTTPGAPPANDDCAGAISISCASTPVSGTTLNSTVDASYINAGTGGTNTTERGVWYTIAGDDNEYTITTCDPTVGYDSRISVYSGSCGALTPITGNDDMTPACASASFRSEVTFNAFSGTTYYVFVHGYQSGTGLSTTGNFNLNITCAALCVPIPSNEDCASAAVLTGNATCVNTAGDNGCASASALANPTTFSAFATLNDVWYQFTPDYPDNSITITLGTATQMGFAFYSGTCGSLVQGASVASVPSGVALNYYGFTVGVPMYIRVLSAGVNSGSFDICMTEFACAYPTAAVATATSSTNVDVVITGAAGDYIIEYGAPGFTPGLAGTAGVGGTIVTTSTLTTSVSVAADSNYDFYVRKDCSGTSEGYSFNQDAGSVTTYTVVPFTGTASITTCSATIYDHAATGDYLANANGSLTIYPGNPSGILSLSGTFSTEDTYDYLTFYEGVGTGGTLLADYTGVGTVSVAATAPNTPITVVFTSDVSFNDSGFQFTASCQEVCTDIPASAALTGNASVCPDESVDISLATPEVGLTYIWQKRTTVGGAWTTIPGETGPTLTATQTVNTQYRARLGCVYYDGGTATVPTQTWSVSMNSYQTCYCTALGETGFGTNISNVTSGGIDQDSPITGGADYTQYAPGAGTTTTYLRGGQYPIDITTGDEDNDYVAAWIDYNHSGSFELSERLTLSGSLLAGETHSASFTVPNSAILGTTTMRVRIGWGTTGASMDACTDLSGFIGGETEDYTVTIAAGASNDAIANATVVSPPIYPACLNLSGNLALATDDPSDLSSTGADLWYTFTAASNACRVAVSGGTATNTQVEIEAAGGVTMGVVEDATTANGNEIFIIDDLAIGTQYWVAVRNGVGGFPGTFSVCIQSLAASTCDNGPSFPSLCSSFKADWTGTSSYTATFTSQDVPGNVYTYTTSNSSWIPLSIVPATLGNVDAGGLQYGESYTVAISANYNLPDAAGVIQNAVASPASSTCSINIAPVAGLNMGAAYNSVSSGTLVTPGSNPRVQGSWIQTDFYVCGASSYLWSISEVNYLNGTVQVGPAFQATTTSRQMRLWPTNIPNLAAGKRYQILVAPVFPWGPGAFNVATQRYVQIAGSAGMVEENINEEIVLVDKSLQSGVFASLYPNPSNGEMVNINIAGIESESVNIRIMDASGRTVWSNNFFVEGILATTVNFDRPLAAGIYMVEMNYNGEISTQRMVVQK